MKVKSAVFASREHGMGLRFLSEELMEYKEQIEDTFLPLMVSKEDGEGYLIEAFCGYLTVGKITRHEQTVYEKRPNQVFHIFFLNAEEFMELQNELCQGKMPIFLEEPDEELSKAEEISCQQAVSADGMAAGEALVSEESRECIYLSMLDFSVQETGVYKLKNDLGIENAQLFLYFMSYYKKSLLERISFCIGCSRLEVFHPRSLMLCKNLRYEKEDMSVTELFDKLAQKENAYASLTGYKYYYYLTVRQQYQIEETEALLKEKMTENTLSEAMEQWLAATKLLEEKLLLEKKEKSLFGFGKKEVGVYKGMVRELSEMRKKLGKLQKKVCGANEI